MVEVYTAGDDYGFECDRYFWRLWITQNITETGFDVQAHNTNAERAVVLFDDPQLELLFLLKAPQYIEVGMIKRDPTKHWILGESGPFPNK